MLEVKGIKNGIVLDHINSGNGLKVFNKLMLDKVENSVVLVMNVESKEHGRKDIIKIENTFDVDLGVLGLIDPDITVNFIKDGKVSDKKSAFIPKEISGAFECENPRCITNFDSYVKPSFKLLSSDPLEYICSYCEEITELDI